MNSVRKYIATIKPGYHRLNSIYLGSDALKDDRMRTGTVIVRLAGQSEFSTEGTLTGHGLLSGMVKLYRSLQLEDETEVEFSFSDDGNLIVHSPQPPIPEISIKTDRGFQETQLTVFERDKLRYIHLEPFRVENLNHWEPETETDVYMAFGVLQGFTEYRYCCGASASLLKKLGAIYTDSSKPDAVLIDHVTNYYLMAEWKKNSSDYKSNHRPGDVDVLICWVDNETDRTKLPPKVISLRTIARQSALVDLGTV